MVIAGPRVRLSEVIAGLSTALDLTEGQRPGHSVRSCAIGMRLTEVLGLSRELRSALFYALLMKDLGCSSNASHFATLFAADDQTLKTRLSLVNWSRALESFRFVAEERRAGTVLESQGLASARGFLERARKERATWS